MSNKLVKSLLLSGLGLIGLTVALLGVGKAVASQQRAELDENATEFFAQFPVTETNDSARELDRLSTRLGMVSSEQSKTTPQVDEQKAEAFAAIHEILGNYLESQEQKTGGPLEPVPAELTDFLAQHQAELDAVKQHLATAEAPVWEQDPERMADLSSYALSSFLNLGRLNKLLLVEAIAHSQNNQPEEMLEVLAIAQKLHEPLKQRPDLLSYLTSLLMEQNQVGVLRHLDGVSVELAEQLLAGNRQEAGQQALGFETWMMYEGMQKLASGETVEQQLGEEEKPGPFKSLLFSLSAADTARVMDDHYQQLEDFNMCSSGELAELDLSQVAWWNSLGDETAQPFAEVVATKGSRRMLELELTQKVLQAKAQKQGDKWPKQLLGLESQVCPGETWVYEVTPEGKMSLAFSYEFEETADGGDLPLRYEGE